MLNLLDKLRGLLLAILRQGAKLQLPQTAASLTFLSLLALVPVLSIVLAVLAALPVFTPMRAALQHFLVQNLLLPSFADSVFSYLTQFASKAAQLPMIGAIAFFVTAFTSLLTLESTLNRIWAVEHPRPLTRRIVLYWMLLTMGPLVLGVSLAVTGMVVSDWIASLRGPVVMVHTWVRTLPWLLGWLSLSLVYTLLPNAQVRWRDALLGALFASLTIEVLRRLIGAYVVNLPAYTVVYGAFAALPLLLLWLYLCWLAVLAGALLAANLRHWGSGSLVYVRWSAGQSFEAAAAVLGRLVERVGQGQPTMSVGALRDLTGPEPAKVEQLGQLLAERGYINRLWRMSAHGADAGDRMVWDEEWALAKPPSELTLRPLFDALWLPDGHPMPLAIRRPDSPPTRFPGLRIDLPWLEQPLSELALAGRVAPAS